MRDALRDRVRVQAGRNQSLTAAVVVTVGNLQDRGTGHRLLTSLRAAFPQSDWSSSKVAIPDGHPWATRVLALPVRIIRSLPGVSGFHVRIWVWTTERTFSWIGKCRRCARDYETRHDHQEAMIYLVMIDTMSWPADLPETEFSNALSESGRGGGRRPDRGLIRYRPGVLTWVSHPQTNSNASKGTMPLDY